MVRLVIITTEVIMQLQLVVQWMLLCVTLLEYIIMTDIRATITGSNASIVVVMLVVLEILAILVILL